MESQESTQKVNATVFSQPFSEALLPFLPMVYVAWADGVLTPTELSTIQEQLHKQAWLGHEDRLALERWLDPANPPSAVQLQAWLVMMRQLGKSLPTESQTSLAHLGIEMARAGSQHEVAPEALQALEALEGALGMPGQELCREILPRSSESLHNLSQPPAFGIEAMTAVLDADEPELRQQVRALLRDPVFARDYSWSKEEYREKVLVWCKDLASRGWGALSFPKAQGGQDALGSFITVFEMLAHHDLSLVVKFGVQFGLFGGGILNLGTTKHHEAYLKEVGTLELPGCFAMTESGHGSNVQDLETTARYDRDRGGFVIHTPHDGARKDYIGNAALHGQSAVVFAQLLVDDANHGVHAFVVPIRTADGRLCDGIRAEDCGEKMGLNGVDNGRLWFDEVFVPRDNLLDRFGQVDEDGLYHSDIQSTSRRFFSMLGTLVGGRVSVASGALSAAKTGLAIAIRYGASRRQFGPAGRAEVPLLDYQTHQRRLMPLLAQTYALHFASRYLKRRYLTRTEEDSREVEGLAAGLKSICTWHATKTLQECRECCGGQGYLAANRFADLKADTDVFTTFEGDNTVLMQLVSKGLLTEFKRHFNELKFFDLVKYVALQASNALSERNPVTTRMTDPAHLRGSAFHLNAFRFRENDLLISVAQRLKKKISNGEDSFVAFTLCQDHLMALAHAHVERIVLEQFIEATDACQDDACKDILQKLCQLYALSRIEADRGWFLENDYIENNKAKAIRKQVLALCRELRPQAIHLVNAFAIPTETISAPIAIPT